jgi:DNA-binding transcriptional regulator LsrR (DeoR family)
MAAWLRVERSAEPQRIVHAERDEHPQEHVRRKMLVLWLLHHGITRQKAASIAGLGRATVQRYVTAFGEGGLDGLRAWRHKGPVSDLAAHAQAIKAVTNTAVVNTETMCELLRKLAAVGLVGTVTLVLDNARYQHNQAVKDLAASLGKVLLFLPARLQQSFHTSHN